jgi:hypothetical protein
MALPLIYYQQLILNDKLGEFIIIIIILMYIIMLL